MGDWVLLQSLFSSFFAAFVGVTYDYLDDNEGHAKFHLEEVNDFTWKPVYVVIESIRAKANGFHMPWSGTWKGLFNFFI